MAESIAFINKSFLPANYEADKLLQKVIELVKTREGAKISRLPNPWRERFAAFSVDEKNFLYRDDRLVIPQNLKKSILTAVHYGHPGRDTMLRTVAEIWWPNVHRDVINTAKMCQQCQQAGKSVETLPKQTAFGKKDKS